ncbi:MAG: Crp/Fnr family transcriptional regulator [Candidatus Kapaibacteriota bacterium]
MHPVLRQYLTHFSVLGEEEIREIAENIPVQDFKKGAILLKEGEIADKCYFVLKGCVRQYHCVDDEEKTTAFFTEKQAVVSFASYSQRIPGKHYWSCVEDSTLIIGSLDHEQEMYQKFPKLAAITRALVEQDFGKTQEDFATFITSSPEERYLNLLESRPELLHRAPQHQIASYLGVTPESLSRIRKRLVVKK